MSYVRHSTPQEMLEATTLHGKDEGTIRIEIDLHKDVHYLSIRGLLELRAEIDRFLFTEYVR